MPRGGPARLRLGGTAAAVGDARRFVRSRTSTVPAELTDAAELVASELATNALVHGGTPRELLVELRGEGVWLAVHDESPEAPAARRPRLEALDGRGLAIVAALAADWGYVPGRRGKQVWALLTPESVQRATATA